MKVLVKYIILLAFLANCSTYTLTSSEGESISVEASSTEKIDLTPVIEPYKKSLDSSMNQVLNVSDVEMSTGSPEGLLGNFVSDLCLKLGKEYNLNSGKTVDFVLLNNGGLRTSLPKGNVTRRKIYEIMPFENELVVVTLTPEKTAELFKYIGAKTVEGGTRKQGVPVSRNVKVTLKGQSPVEVLVDSVPLRGRNYRVLTSDYLANGGDDMSFFLTPEGYEKLGVKLRDAILYYVESEKKEGRALTAVFDQRISYAK